VRPVLCLGDVVDGLMFCDGMKGEDGAGYVRRNFGWRLGWGVQGVWSGFFDDGWWSAWVWALGEFRGGEEFGVATGAVA